jgi:hypothetical protein
MKRAAILLMLAAGCSTAPVADLLDRVKPANPADLVRGPGRGGVSQPALGATMPPPGALAGPPPIATPEPGFGDDRLPPIEPPPVVR